MIFIYLFDNLRIIDLARFSLISLCLGTGWDSFVVGFGVPVVLSAMPNEFTSYFCKPLDQIRAASLRNNEFFYFPNGRNLTGFHDP